MKLSYGLILILLTPLLASCEQLGLENPAAEQARVEAEGKAIGSGCRQTGRALEDCYDINRRAPKAAIFTGWRDMDAYMRENKIEEIKPDAPMKSPPGKSRPEASEEIDKPAETKPAQKDATAASKPAATIDKQAPEAKSAPARRPALAR
ncbi:MAG: hypothetical protein Q8O52_00215 [Sulfuritalea sp.]|nr:hypothetical protein [Sulfuritalea sp.]